MLKTLRMLAVLAIATISVSSYAKPTEQPKSDDAQKVYPSVISQSGVCQPCENAKNPQKPPFWEKVIAWPEGITTIAVICTLFVIAWQSVETRKAAQAGLLNAQALINAERPWIMATVEEVVGPTGGFGLYITNKGRTPAMITGAYIGAASVLDVTALPEKSPYFRGNMVKDRIILPEEKQSITWFDGTTIKRLANDESSDYFWEREVYVFGKILYRDLLSAPSKVPHETRWIGLYRFPSEDFSDSIFSFQGIGIPDEYDRYT
jgi:hypothetical protein